MAGSALGFQSNRLGINQVLAVKPGPGGVSGFPRTRTALLSISESREPEASHRASPGATTSPKTPSPQLQRPSSTPSDQP
jgi:cyclopropane-fatty-acyl-phospholipid synthase